VYCSRVLGLKKRKPTRRWGEVSSWLQQHADFILKIEAVATLAGSSIYTGLTEPAKLHPPRGVSSISIRSLILITNSATIHHGNHERHELDRASARHIRSGRCLQALPAIALSVRRSGHSFKKYQPGSQVVAHTNLVAEEAAPEQSQRQEQGQSLQCAHSPL
jgi:hypothetical protein